MEEIILLILLFLGTFIRYVFCGLSGKSKPFDYFTQTDQVGTSSLVGLLCVLMLIAIPLLAIFI